MLVSHPGRGVLVPGTVLTKQSFQSDLALSESALRAMRRAGLRTLRYGKRTFVIADDAIEFLKAKGKPVA